MKTMGRWVPIPDMLEWWIPLGVAIPVCAFFLWKARRYKETYFRWAIVFHVLYLGWFVLRGVGAVLTGSRLDSSRYFYRVVMLLLAVFLVTSTYSQAKKRLENKRVRKLHMGGPSETLWSPDPIVGYRITIHSLGGEYFAGGPARCRMGDQFHEAGMAPVWGCHCGYYAMKVLRDVIPYPDLKYEFAVIVLMWGKVVECEDGYRAQYMQPIGYWGRKPAIRREQMFDIITFSGATRTVNADPDSDRCKTFHNLPVVNTPEALDALVEKAQKEFDPDASPPYDGEDNGYR